MCCYDRESNSPEVRGGLSEEVTLPLKSAGGVDGNWAMRWELWQVYARHVLRACGRWKHSMVTPVVGT